MDEEVERSRSVCYEPRMAIGYPAARESLDAVVDRWRERCLLRDESLLFEGDQVWTPGGLARVYHNVVETPLLDRRSFLENFEIQLEGDRSLVRLGAEAMGVYYLFAHRSAVSPETKRARIAQILSWGGDTLDDRSVVWRGLESEGVAHPGQYFLLRPDVQLAYIVDFARRLKEHDTDERHRILNDPWRLRDFADEGADEGSSSMRHVLLHLLHPESFERISSGDHKHSIVSAYSGLIDGDLSTDEALLAIRVKLGKLLDVPAESLDFYEPPLAGTWGATAADGADLAAMLELKQQVILFGPPGTSKTFEAKELAENIIRRQALKRWGPVAYFKQQPRITEIVETHVERRQLHPAYSYEEFIRGQRLTDGGSVVYEDGDLLRLIDRIENESVPDGEPRLPWVLILDEINRADLSRVFGEAFSVLEDRNSPIALPGTAAGAPPRTIRMPSDLYVIGTMNLIDQSLEQIDFALRRRFFWHRSSFDKDRLARVLEKLWSETVTARRFPWNRIRKDMDEFVERATALNDEIARSKLLGRDYVVGHTYFFDVVKLLAGAERMSGKTNPNQFLWNKRGEALEPGAVRDLWRMSIEPLLDQYLQGVDPDQRRIELARLSVVLVAGQA